MDGQILPVVADVTCLPFADATFDSVTSAETLEHIPDDSAAVAELARVVSVGGCIVGTVPAGPEQWSEWDDWAGHVRRYTVEQMRQLLSDAGLETSVVRWGWPVLRLYDGLFLLRVNRRRLASSGSVEDDPKLRTVASLGRRRWLVRAVMGAFACDRVFDGVRWGVGVLFAARKPERGG
jgi:SAM-dependent methyltransferase